MRSKEREAEKKNASEKKEKSTAQNILGTIAYIIGVCVFVFLILHFVGQRTVVNGSSMDTTLANGQNLVMDKLSYRFHDPERYDIIIFPGPEEFGQHPYYIKRIIGMPGETVQIKDGKVYINDKELKSDVYGITDYIDYPGIADTPHLRHLAKLSQRPDSYPYFSYNNRPFYRTNFFITAILTDWPIIP